MNEFFVSLESADGIEALFDEIFHGLDVVVRHALDFLDTCGIGFGKGAVDITQAREEVVGKGCQLWQWQFAKCDEVFYLDAYAVAYECELREILVERLCFRTVAAIDGRNGRE